MAELDRMGNVVSRFAYGTRPNVPDYLEKGGQTYRLLSDHLGSPRIVTNVNTGEIAQRLDYDEFGRVILDTNPGFQAFGFAGGLYDHQTGFVRFGARDYDSQIGRWTTKDANRFAGGYNFYSYCWQDPINFLDPTGRVPMAETLTLGGILVAADGSVPVGDIIAAGLVVGMGTAWAVEKIRDWWTSRDYEDDPTDNLKTTKIMTVKNARTTPGDEGHPMPHQTQATLSVGGNGIRSKSPVKISWVSMRRSKKYWNRNGQNTARPLAKPSNDLEQA